MKKVLILILAVILSLSVFAMAACQQPCETHVDGNHDGICDVCEEAGLSVTHTDTNHDGKCDGCGGDAKFEHVDAEHNGQCDVCKKPVAITHVDANTDGTCDVCKVLIDHTHADADNDGVCDVPTCDYEFPWVADLASAKEFVNSMYLMGAEVTAADFKVITNVPVGSVNFTITWSIESEVEGQTAVVLGAIDENTKQQLVDVDTMSTEVVDYKLVGTISDAEGHSTTVEYVRQVPIGFKMNETHPYAAAIYQGTLGKTLYLDGGVSGRYLTMTEDATKAIAVYAEKAEGGYKLYILDGETKKYITIYANSEGKTSVNYDAAGATVYAYNPAINAFFTTFNNGEVYLGTYNNYNTVSVSNISYITPENTGKSQFPLEMLPVADGGTYAAYITQAQQNKVVYVTGDVSGRYLATSENAAEAVVIYAEKVTGGYKFYKLNGETKEYITIYANDEDKDSVKFDAAGTTVFSYDPVVNAWVSNFKGKDKYLGTYSSYTTVSVSNLSYITAENTGKSQFPLEFKLVAGGPVVEEHKCESKCPTCGLCLDKDCTETACAEKCKGHEAVAAPVAGTYTISMYHTTNKVELYLVAQMSGYYIASTQNQAEAEVITLVKLDNGNYTMQLSTGKYLAVVQSGTHFNAVMQDTACEWQWNSTYNTLTVTIDGAEYYLGTYGTYTTFGASNISKAPTSYVAHLTAVGSVVPPVVEHTCESKCPTCGLCLDPTCTETACLEKCKGHEVVDNAPVAGTYIIKMVQSNLNKTLYFTGAMDGYYFATSENVADAVVVTLAKLDSGKYTMQLANGKYLAIIPNGTYTNVVMQDAVCEWAWNATLGNFTVTISGTEYFLGTNSSKTYDTIAANKSSYASTTFHANLVEYVAPTHKCESVCPECGKCTNEDCAESVCANKCEGHPVAVVINGVNYTQSQVQEALLGLKAGDVVVINTNGTIDKEYTFVAADYTLGEGAVLTIQANAVAPADAKLTVGAGSVIVVESGATIDISALTQEDFATSTEARLEIANGATVIMPAYTEALWNDAYLKVVIEAMVADSDFGAKLVLGSTTLTKTHAGWVAPSTTVVETAHTLNPASENLTSDKLTEAALINDIFTATVGVKSEGIKLAGASYEADGLTFDSRQISLTTGKADLKEGVWNNSISFTVEAGKTAKVVIYAGAKADKTITLVVFNADKTAATVSGLKIDGVEADAFNTLPTTSVSKYEFALAEGTYHIGGSGGGAYVYGMNVTLCEEVAGHSCETICLECGKCLDKDCTETACAEKCEGHKAAPVTVTKTIAEIATANSWADSTLYASFSLDENITVSSAGTPVDNYALNTGKYYASSSTWRIYQNETPSLTITAAEGYTIVSVKVTYSVKNSGTLTLDSANIASDTVVTVNGTSVTFSVGNTGTKTNGQAQVKAIEVVYEG